MFTCSSGVKECLACCTADPQTMLDHQLEQAALLLHEFPDAQGSPEKSILLFTLLRREGVISIHYHLMCPQHTKKTALAAQSQSTTVCVANAARSPPCGGKVWALPWDRWALSQGYICLQFHSAARPKRYSPPRPTPIVVFKRKRS